MGIVLDSDLLYGMSGGNWDDRRQVVIDYVFQQMADRVQLVASSQEILGATELGQYNIVKPTKLEKLVLDSLERAMWRLHSGERKLVIGISDIAEGWTDGKTYIAVSRSFLKRCSLGTESGWNGLIALLCHELCHDSADACTHEHTFDFYLAYHDMSTQKAPDAARYAFLHFLTRAKRVAAKTGRKLDKRKQAELHRRAEAFVAYWMLHEDEPKKLPNESVTDED